MQNMDIDKYIAIKRFQKDVIKNSSTKFDRSVIKKNVFPISNDCITIGEKKYILEEMLLDKLQLDDNIKKSILQEYELLFNKFNFLINSKEKQIKKIDQELDLLNENINYLKGAKNQNAYQLIYAFKEFYNSIITFNTIFKDNILEKSNNYCFFNGERSVLKKEDYDINIISTNYKAEIVLKESKFINYITTEEIYKTNESFKIHFLYKGENFKTVNNFIVGNGNDITVNERCDKIIIEGFSLNSIINNFSICIGLKNTNLNRGIVILEADIAKIKLQDNFILKAYKDIKCFSVKKNKYKKFDSYVDFKSNYYLPETEIQPDKITNIDLVDSYLILFIETDLNIISKISLYGVD